jgi:predicted transcriptional regulator
MKISTEQQLRRELKKRRQKMGLKQAQLARIAGVNQSHISRIESLDLNFQISTLFKVLDAMNMKIVLEDS